MFLLGRGGDLWKGSGRTLAQVTDFNPSGRFPPGRALRSYCTGLSHQAGIRCNR